MAEFDMDLFIENIKTYGQPSLEKLFALDKATLLNTLKRVISGEKPLELLDDDPRVRKVLIDDKPEKIELYFYDLMTINASGISYKPEHGVEKRVFEFNEFSNFLTL